MRENRPRQLCLTRGMLAFLLQHPRLVPAVAIPRRLAIHTRGNRRLEGGAADVVTEADDATADALLRASERLQELRS